MASTSTSASASKAKKPRRQYIQDDMDKAVAAVRGGMGRTAAAKLYKVPRSSLGDKLNGKYSVKYAPKSALTEG